MADGTPQPFDGPEWLAEDARGFWNKIAPDLKLQGLLRASQEEPLGRYCDALARWHRLRLKIDGGLGETYETESKHGKLLRVNPDFKVLGELESWLMSFEDRFALSPMMFYKLKGLRQAVGDAAKGLPMGAPAAFGVPPDPDGEIPGEREPASPFGGMSGNLLN